MENNTNEYFRQGMKEFFTDSPVPISSSMWLNDPRIRDFVAKHSLRRNHKDFPQTVEITEIVPILRDYQKHGTGFVEAMFTEERKNNAALDAWFDEGFTSSLNLETLKGYPHGSVGNIFYRYLIANDFVPEFAGVPIGSPQMDYFYKRLSQQHDLEHILGGFGFEYLGEQGVTWMRHAAYHRHLSPGLAGVLNITYAFLLAPSILRTMLHYPQTFETLWDVINQGVAVGRASDPIFMMKYEPVLHLAPADAREQLGYRSVVEMRVKAMADIWADNGKTAIDPRLEDETRQAAE
jgi:ubiquinone biosynthesis protein COQ4